MKRLSHSALATLFLLAGSSVWACSNNPEASTKGDGDGDTPGDGDGDGDGDISIGDGDGDGDGDTGDGDTGDGDGDTGLGGSFSPEWDYPDDVTFDYTPITGGGETCGSVSGTPESVSRPIDIIFIIDNSGSMQNEIEEVEENVYSNFVNIIEASEIDIDYRVIMISRYGNSSGGAVGGSDYQVCIPTPLGGHDCVNPNSKMPVNGPRFFHYSADIESTDGLCVLLESYDEPDEFDPDNNPLNDGGIRNTWSPLAPSGWQQWLREGAFKTFVMITDDNVHCDTDDLFVDGSLQQNFDVRMRDNNSNTDASTVATTFDTALLSLSATQFGTAMERNYVFHSIVGLNENNPATDPWAPTDAMVGSTCDSGPPGRGAGYQALSRLTGGLRYPICAVDGGGDFDPIFDEIAQGVIESAAIPCEYDFPTVDGIINPDNIVVNYTPSGGGSEVTFNRVTDMAACTAGNDYYFDDNTTPTKLFLCGSACTTVQNDGGDLELDFGCLGS